MDFKYLPEYGYFSAVEFTNILNNNLLKENVTNFSPINENTNHGIGYFLNESLTLQYKCEIDRLMKMCHYNQHPNKVYFEDFVKKNSLNQFKGLKYFNQIMIQENSSSFNRLNNVNKKVSNLTNLSYVANQGYEHLAQSKIIQNRKKMYPGYNNHNNYNQLLNNKLFCRNMYDRMGQVHNEKFTGNTNFNIKYLATNGTRNFANLETEILKQNTMEHIFTKSEKEIFHNKATNRSQFGPKNEIYSLNPQSANMVQKNIL